MLLYCRLTAFVLKVFCQAKAYIDIDQNVICGGMNWLFAKQNNNGSFTENSAVYHKEIMVCHFTLNVFY